MVNTMQPQNHRRQRSLLVIVLAILLVAVIVLVIIALLTKRTAEDRRHNQDSDTTVDVVGQGELQGNEQRGIGKIETECYTFEVPRSVSLGVNQYCAVDLGYGSGEGSVLVVAPHRMTYSSESSINFEKTVEDYKKQLQADAITIESEQSIKLDNQDARRLTTVKGNDKKILILAPTKTSTKFDSTGRLVQGILISTPNITKENTEVIDGVIKTWRWL